MLFDCPIYGLDPLLPLCNVLEWLNVEDTFVEESIPPRLQACITRGLRPWALDGPVVVGDEDTPEGQLAWEDPFVSRAYARYSVS